MKRGEIYEGAKRGRKAAKHPIVFLRGYNDKSFIGAVLTHSDKKGNALMKKDRFRETASNGSKYSCLFDDTHVVQGRFFKPDEWGPYKKVGELTDDGIAMVEALVKGMSPSWWDDYVKS